MLNSIALFMSFPNTPPQTEQFPILGEEIQSLSWLKCHEIIGACGSTFVVQKGKFFVLHENICTYFKFMKAQEMSTH